MHIVRRWFCLTLRTTPLLPGWAGTSSSSSSSLPEKVSREELVCILKRMPTWRKVFTTNKPKGDHLVFTKKYKLNSTTRAQEELQLPSWKHKDFLAYIYDWRYGWIEQTAQTTDCLTSPQANMEIEIARLWVLFRLKKSCNSPLSTF